MVRTKLESTSLSALLNICECSSSFFAGANLNNIVETVNKYLSVSDMSCIKGFLCIQVCFAELAVLLNKPLAAALEESEAEAIT